MKRIVVAFLVSMLILLAGCPPSEPENTITPGSKKIAKAKKLYEELTAFINEHQEQIEIIRLKAEEIKKVAPHSDWARKADNSVSRSMDIFIKQAEKDCKELLEKARAFVEGNDLKKAIEILWSVNGDYNRKETKQFYDKVQAEGTRLSNIVNAEDDYKTALQGAKDAADKKDFAAAVKFMDNYIEQYPSAVWARKAKSKRLGYLDLDRLQMARDEAVKPFKDVKWRTLYDGRSFSTIWAVVNGGEYIKDEDKTISCSVGLGPTATFITRVDSSKDALVDFHVRIKSGALWVLFRAAEERGAWSFDHWKMDGAKLGLDSGKFYKVRVIARGDKIVWIIQMPGKTIRESKPAGVKDAGKFGFMIVGPAEVEIRNVQIKMLKD